MGAFRNIDWSGRTRLGFHLRYSPIWVPHHDFVGLPNGNVLLVVKERKTAAEAITAGHLPASVPKTRVTCNRTALIEIKPTGKTTGEVVWEWHLWDHLIQDIGMRRKPTTAMWPRIQNAWTSISMLRPIDAPPRTGRISTRLRTTRSRIRSSSA